MVLYSTVYYIILYYIILYYIILCQNILYDDIAGARSVSLSDRMTMAIELAVRKSSQKMTKRDVMQTLQGKRERKR